MPSFGRNTKNVSPPLLDPSKWFNSNAFYNKFTGWFAEFKRDVTSKIESLQDFANDITLDDFTDNLGLTLQNNIFPDLVNGMPETMRDIITGGNGTLNVGNAKTDTGIKNVVDAIINWVIDTFISPFIMLFKALFGWIINPISAAFGSVYGLFISICYVFIIVILVGIILDIFSIAKIWAG